MSDNVEKADDYLRKFTRELPVTLNDHELQTYGKMLAEKCKEQELAIEKKKQVVADHTGRIKVITNEIKRIADARAKGEELRPVQCAEHLHGNVIEIVRLDRGEVVDTRPAELRDLQTSIPGTDSIPEDFDEGPRGEEMGGPNKTGRAVDTTIDPGESGTSSSGDTVWNGAPNDTDDDTLICDACGEVVVEEDETTNHDGSTIHTKCVPADGKPTFPHLVENGPYSPTVIDEEEDEIDRKLRERESDPDYGGANARKAADAKMKAEQVEAEKPKRERSKKANEAKSGDKPKSKRKK